MAVKAPFFKRRFSLVLTSSLVLVPVSSFTFANSLTEDQQWRCQADETNNWVCDRVEQKTSRWSRAQRPEREVVASESPKAPAPIDKPAPVEPRFVDPSSLEPKTETITSETIAESVETTQEAPVTATLAPSAKGLPLRQTLDWAPLAQLTTEQREGVAAHCSGRYLEPPRQGMDIIGSPSGLTIHAEADTSEYLSGEHANMAGNILLRQGNRQVKSDFARLDEETNTSIFTGNVELREPNLLLVGDDASVQMETGRVEINNAYFAMHGNHARGSASSLVRREDGVIDMTDAHYTTCPPENNSWVIVANDINLNNGNGFGTAKHAVLKIKDVPVFYTPYIHFPIDDQRKTGFLYPEIGYSDQDGMTLVTPYYFNLAPNYDATLRPKIFTDRGELLEGQFRYLTGTGEGELGGGYMPNDDLKDENRNYDEDRWLINFANGHKLSKQWDVNVDFANSSDKDYLRDFSTTLDVSATDNLNQQLVTQYRGGDDELFWKVKANAQGFENMRQDKDDPYEKIPQLEFKGGWNVNDQLSLNTLADTTYFTRDSDWKYIGKVPEWAQSDFDKENDVERSVYDDSSYELANAKGGRAYMEAGPSYTWDWPFAYITPTVKAKTVHYNLNNLDREGFEAPDANNPEGLDYDTSPSTSTMMYSLDSGLKFDRSINYFDSSYTQTLEPRLYYLYVPTHNGQDQNPLFDTTKRAFSYSALWREDRFSSYDRLGDANQVSLGVSTRLLNEQGLEKVSFSIGQTYFFEDREVFADPGYGKVQDEPGSDSDLSQARQWTLEEAEADVSPIATELTWNINNANSLRQDWIYNVDQSWNNEYSFAYNYSPNPSKVLDFAYRFSKRPDRTKKDDDGNAIPEEFTDGSISQSDVSAIWPIYGNWSAMGRWLFDITNSEDLEFLAGAEYDTCCYKLRLLHRTSLTGNEDDIDNAETEKAFVIQFVLKGIGGFGAGTTFLKGIKGYTEHDKSTNL